MSEVDRFNAGRRKLLALLGTGAATFRLSGEQIPIGDVGARDPSVLD